MKKYFSVAALMMVCVPLFSQTKGVEMFDFLTAISIPQQEAVNLHPWKSLAAHSSTIKWKQKAPVKVGTEMQQSGIVALNIGGEKFICEDEIGGKKADCSWEATFQGNSAGYDHVSISTFNFPVNEPGTEIRMLFPKQENYFKLISKCIEGASYWVNMYEVKIPGRKTFWMIATYESMSATAAQYENSGVANNFYVVVYFGRKMAEDNCTN